tara:strand:+ start:281 stop:670 length:390 start_codon:yes stop_codon:yes gene_type:complete
MESKELRIGNWVNFIPDNGNFIVSEIDAFNSWSKTINGLCPDDIKPIPLTEEWLLKFGFVIHNKPHGYTEYIKYKKGTRQYLHKLFTFKEYNDWDGKFGFSGTIQTELNHVHELQNLYYALTKKELTIK